MKTLTTTLLAIAAVALMTTTSEAGPVKAGTNVNQLLSVSQQLAATTGATDLQLVGHCHRGGGGYYGGGGYGYGAPAYQNSFYGGGYGGYGYAPRRAYYGGGSGYYGRPYRGGGRGGSGIGLYINF